MGEAHLFSVQLRHRLRCGPDVCDLFFHAEDGLLEESVGESGDTNGGQQDQRLHEDERGMDSCVLQFLVAEDRKADGEGMKDVQSKRDLS